jgi:hypothetical protein
LYRGEKLGGGALNFLKPERGALKKYRETKEGPGFENIYQFEKTLTQNNLTNNNVYRPSIFINGSQIESLLCSCIVNRQFPL